MTQDFIQYRIEKAEEVYQAACILYEAGQWNSAVNRLYYACFYVASALLLQQKIGAKSHAGVIAKFSENVVRTGKMDADTYKVYSKLLNWRSKGDYSDMFDFCQEDVDMVLGPTRRFIDCTVQLIRADE